MSVPIWSFWMIHECSGLRSKPQVMKWVPIGVGRGLSHWIFLRRRHRVQPASKKGNPFFLSFRLEVNLLSPPIPRPTKTSLAMNPQPIFFFPTIFLQLAPSAGLAHSFAARTRAPISVVLFCDFVEFGSY